MTPEPPPAWAIAMFSTGVMGAGLIVPMVVAGGVPMEQVMPYYVLSFCMMAGGLYISTNQDP